MENDTGLEILRSLRACRRYCKTDHGTNIGEFLPGSAATGTDDPLCIGFKTFGLVAAPGFVVASCSLAFIMRYYRRRLRHQGLLLLSRALSRPSPPPPRSLPLAVVVRYQTKYEHWHLCMDVSMCMYVCEYVHVYVDMYVCLCISMHAAYTQMSVLKFKPLPPPLSTPRPLLPFIFLLGITSQRTRILCLPIEPLVLLLTLPPESPPPPPLPSAFPMFSFLAYFDSVLLYDHYECATLSTCLRRPPPFILTPSPIPASPTPCQPQAGRNLALQYYVLGTTATFCMACGERNEGE